MKRVLFASGGSGGHLAPAIAMAQSHMENERGRCWVGTTRKTVDKKMQSTYGNIGFVEFLSRPLVGNPIQLLKSIIVNFAGAMLCAKYLVQNRVEFIFATGGFGCVPAIVGGILLGKPVFLHESNSIPGKVTRLFQPILRQLFVTRLLHQRFRHWNNIEETGFPIRTDFKVNDDSEYVEKVLNLNAERPLITVFGGSQGAKTLSQMAEAMSDQWIEKDFQVCCVTGPENYTPTSQNGRFTTVPFVEKMADLLAASDVIIARSGAGSIAEIAKIGCKCILVPLPGSADDHQVFNARTFENAGCCITVQQCELENVVSIVDVLLDNTQAAGENMLKSQARWRSENGTAAMKKRILAKSEGCVV